MPGQQPITRQVLAQYICSILQNFCQSVKVGTFQLCLLLEVLTALSDSA